MNAAQATRPIYWNVSHVWLMYVLLIPTVAAATYGILLRVRRWRRGLPLSRFDRPMARLSLVIRHAVAQQRTARDQYAGLFHRFIAYGFVVLTIATTLVAFDADLGTSILHGWFYLVFQSFIVDVFGALVLVGIAMAALRRWIAHPEKLVYSGEAALILVALFVIVLTGFLIEGWRIAATNDPWAAWSPFGNAVARLSRPLMDVAALRAAHRATWWFHLLVSFSFLAWLP